MVTTPTHNVRKPCGVKDFSSKLSQYFLLLMFTRFRLLSLLRIPTPSIQKQPEYVLIVLIHLIFKRLRMLSYFTVKFWVRLLYETRLLDHVNAYPANNPFLNLYSSMLIYTVSCSTRWFRLFLGLYVFRLCFLRSKLLLYIDIEAIAACRQAADRTCPDAYISLPHNYQAYFVMRTTYTPSIYCLLISQDLGFDPPCSTPIRCPHTAAVVLSLNIRNNNIVNELL